MRYDNPELRDMLASEYVLGTLTGAARRRFERLVRDDTDLAGVVQEWERRLNLLNAELAPIMPPAGLKSAIEQRIGQGTFRDGFSIRANEGDWLTLVPGVERKSLSKDGKSATASALYRLAPGTVFEPHEHPSDEECYIIEGDLQVGGAALKGGDYFFIRRGGHHGAIHTRDGALLFIRGEAA
jgi:quercetin dioxygenase-like cupin family protein